MKTHCWRLCGENFTELQASDQSMLIDRNMVSFVWYTRYREFMDPIGKGHIYANDVIRQLYLTCFNKTAAAFKQRSNGTLSKKRRVHYELVF